MVESLNETLVAFRDAVDVIRQSDPAAVREALARIEAEIGRINAKLRTLDELAAELQRRAEDHYRNGARQRSRNQETTRRYRRATLAANDHRPYLRAWYRSL